MRLELFIAMVIMFFVAQIPGTVEQNTRVIRIERTGVYFVQSGKIMSVSMVDMYKHYKIYRDVKTGVYTVECPDGSTAFSGENFNSIEDIEMEIDRLN
jgi:hypothetical protein